MSPEQVTLVSRAVAGDKDALSDLLQQFGPDVEAALFISPKWQGALDAADVMQVTYLEAFTQIRDFDPARAAAFPGWLKRIAENNLRDAIRGLEAKKTPPPHLKLDAHGGDSCLALFDVVTSGGDTPSQIVRRDEARDRLSQMLRCLPPDYERTIRLYDLEGRPIDEVAAELKRSAPAIYMLRSRAHDRLRQLLGSPSAFLSSRA